MVSDNKKMWRFVGNANSLLSLYDHTTGVPPVQMFSSSRLKNYSQYTNLQDKQCDICVNIAGITDTKCSSAISPTEFNASLHPPMATLTSSCRSSSHSRSFFPFCISLHICSLHERAGKGGEVAEHELHGLKLSPSASAVLSVSKHQLMAQIRHVDTSI